MIASLLAFLLRIAYANFGHVALPSGSGPAQLMFVSPSELPSRE